MHAEAIAADPASFEAVINYIDPSAPIGGINFTDRDKSTFSLIPHRMRIESARRRPERFGLEKTGFTWLNRPTACRDFSDPAEVENVYLPEAAALVKEMTGADLGGPRGPGLWPDRQRGGGGAERRRLEPGP